MAENNARRRDEIFSRAVRAGKRTYFFDVKSTRKGEYYLTITESKRKFNNDQGKFYYEKFKLFLYKEDFDKFKNALGETIGFIDENQQVIPEEEEESTAGGENESHVASEDKNTEAKQEVQSEAKDGEADPFNTSLHTNIDFEDLDEEQSSEEVQEQKYYNK